MNLKTLKSDNNNLKQELLLLKIDKNLDKQQSDKSDNKNLIKILTNNKMEMNPVNRLFFLIKVLLIIFTLILLIKYFLQNGLQKLKLT